MAFIDRFGNRQTGTGGFVDYYLPQPKLPDIIDPIDDEPILEDPVNPNILVQQQDDGGNTEEQENEMRFNLEGVNVGAVDYSEIKHKSYEDYLKTTDYQLDRSGVFSQTQFTPEGVDSEGKKLGKRVSTVETMFGLVPYGGAIISQFDTRAVQSPLGQERFAQTFGIGNIAVTGDLIDEYDSLNQIKNDKLNNMATPEAYDYLNFDYGYGMSPTADAKTLGYTEQLYTQGFARGIKGNKTMIADLKSSGDFFTNIGQGKGFGGDTGHAFTIGNRTAYRTKGSGMYKGLPRGMSQNVAKSIEALQNGKNPNGYDPNSNTNEDILSSTTQDGKLTGGYTLSGSFVTVSGQTAAMGYMEDFENMARNNFKAGDLSQKEAQSFARGWLESARSMSRKATAAEKLANLQSWQERAKSAGKMSAVDRKKQKVSAWAIKKSKVVYGGSKTSGMTQEQKEDQFRRDNQQTASQNKAAATRGVSQTISYESDDNSGGFDSGGVGQGGDSYGGLEFAEGGQVGMAEGDQVAPQLEESPQDDGDMILSANELMEGEPESGFIRKPASETTDEEGVTDDNPTLAPNENNPRGAAIIINKQAVDQAGEKNLVKQIQEAREYLRAKGGKSGEQQENNEEGMSEIITADGEIMIQPEEADVIGRKRLLALNERGKKATREVKEKVQPEQPESPMRANEGMEVSSGMGFIDVNRVKRNYGTTNIDQIIQKKVADIFGVREQGEKAQNIAYDFARKQNFKDDDKSEDTLRHILGGGFMADKKLGFAVYNMKENPYINAAYGVMKGEGFNLPEGKAKREGEIDLNNNEFGRALRQKYPNEKEFVKQAQKYVLDMKAGKKVKPVSGFSPMMSLGIIQKEN